jgi:hypothetical protein
MVVIFGPVEKVSTGLLVPEVKEKTPLDVVKNFCGSYFSKRTLPSLNLFLINFLEVTSF